MSSKAELSRLGNLLPTQNQLVDALTSHISLYHSQSRSQSSNTSHNPNPRSSILKWFASLSLHRRASHLTAVDAGFVRVLVQMLSTRRARGHGRYIVLSDILSGDLPSVCFKRSSGLLARVSESDESERAIFDSTRLFSSQEEVECSSSSSATSSSLSANRLDSMMVIEEFVEDFDRFVEVMDGVSDGRFLRGEESELGSDWVELEWLKDKGYYSIEAFVANRLEVALRLAWLNQCSGNVKKRGARLKEKLASAGVAANVYWRKKGCVDWWDNLDSATKNKLFISALGKSAKNLTGEILKAASSASEDELGLLKTGDEEHLRYSYNVNMRKSVSTLATDAEFASNIVPPSASGKSASLSNALNSLIVLRDIVKMTFLCQDSGCDKGKIFFSSLSSICTISDFILRKVRGLLMVISLDCTKLELIAEENVSSSPVKPKGKSGGSSRKKKGRARNTKKLDPVSGGCGELLNKSVKAVDCTVNYEHRELDPKESPKVPQGTDISKTSSLKEPANAANVGKTQSGGRKTRKGKSRKKINGFRNSGEVMDCKRLVAEAPCSVISQDKISNPSSVSLSFENDSSENSVHSTALASLSYPSSSKGLPVIDNMQSIEDTEVAESCQSKKNKSIPSILGKPSCIVNGNTVPFSTHALDGNSVGNGYVNLEKPKLIREPEKQVRVFDIKEKNVLTQEQDGRCLSDTTPSSSSHGPPYEWPSVASPYFLPRYPHLPHATDRLHLDVSRNWHHHFPQTLIPAIHQQNIEAGCNPLLGRQLPMSVDWPPMVRGVCGLAPSRTCNYESGFVPRWHYTYPQEFSNCNMPLNPATTEEERKSSGDFTDLPDLASTHELQEDCDNQWLSEDEMDIHEVDYNQYFGGGVMYWDPSDRPMGGFSRPPSLSSDDSSWAWREADMNRAVDDMVAFSSPYSTNGLTSPTAAFCPPFDTLGPGHQALGYVMTGSEIQAKIIHTPTTLADALSEEDTSRSLSDLTGEVEGKARDSLPYHVLPPIVIPNITRDRSRSEFKRGHDVKSPCLPLSRREHPRVKRPPSPVMRCVTRGPRPPPPSPVSDSRKHRGFPTVRSGSSSPRHWGMRGWFHDGANLEEACLYRDGAEIVWPSWRSNNFSGNSIIQPLPPALLQDRLIAISHIARDQEHPDVALPMQPAELQSCPARKASLSLMHTLLHDEIEDFCKKVAAQNLARKPYITWAVKRVTRSLQVLWPRSRTNIFGSNLTGLALPTSDVDLVVCLPPVRNLEPIKEAGILEGRNGIKETCLQHAARYLANQDWVKTDSLKTVENTAIPIIMLAVEVPHDLIASSTSNVQSPKEEPGLDQGSTAHNVAVVLEESSLPKSTPISHGSPKDSISVRLDISFKSPSHTGLQTTELVKKLTEQFPAAVPLAMVLKQFLADRSLDQSYSGGLSSYCLILLVIRFLQHQHHLGRSINQNYGSLLIDFLYFFGNVFDPRQMRTSVRGSGIYIKRERGCSIDPIHIDDPLFPTNNVGRNCFRIHQCIKAFSEAYVILENECANFASDKEMDSNASPKLLPKVIPSIDLSQE